MTQRQTFQNETDEVYLKRGCWSLHTNDCRYLVCPAATASANPHHPLSVSPAHLAAQAGAFGPACPAACSSPSHASRGQPSQLPRPRQDVQAPQP